MKNKSEFVLQRRINVIIIVFVMAAGEVHRAILRAQIEKRPRSGRKRKLRGCECRMRAARMSVTLNILLLSYFLTVRRKKCLAMKASSMRCVRATREFSPIKSWKTLEMQKMYQLRE